MTRQLIIAVCDDGDQHVRALREAAAGSGAEIVEVGIRDLTQGLYAIRGTADGVLSGVLRPSGADRGSSLEDAVRSAVLWMRKPDLDALSEPSYETWQTEYVREEARAFVDNLAALLPADAWLSSPVNEVRAGLRLVQLAAARDAGLRVPGWALTNEESALPDGPLVLKRLSTRRVQLPRGLRVYTGAFSRDTAESAEFRRGINFIQQRVAVKRELRIVIVGDRLFTFSLERSGSAADYRSEQDDSAWTPAELTPMVADACMRLVTELGLQYAAVDLADDGAIQWFLELNPWGEYLWLDQLVSGAITAALLSELTKRSAERRLAG